MKSIGIAAILVGTLLASSAATAATTYYSGQFCAPNYNYVPSNYTTLYGFRFNGTANDLYCPAYWKTSATNGQSFENFSVTYATVILEKSASNSDPRCWVYQTRYDGALFSSSSLYACSTWGGCSSTDSSTGIAQLNWTNPTNGGSSLDTMNVAIGCTVTASGAATVYQYNFSGM